MNWHLETGASSAGDLPDVIDELALPTDATPEMEEQLLAAQTAAKSLLESKVTGTGDVLFAVELYGTANPSHEPVDGQPNDRVAAALRQVTPAPPDPEQPEGGPVEGKSAEAVDAEERAKAEDAETS